MTAHDPGSPEFGKAAFRAGYHAQPAEPAILGKTIKGILVMVALLGGLAYFVGQGADDLGATADQRKSGTASRGGATLASRGKPAAETGRLRAAKSYGGYELVIPSGDGGHYFLDAEVNGRDLRFIVDTGASAVTLGEADARAVGVNTRILDYNHRVQTANGPVEAAVVTLDRITAGDLELENVRAIVLKTDIGTALLGMSFLNRLSSYQVEDGQMILRW